VVDLPGGPAADMTAAMEEDFEQADDAGVVDLDAGIADRTNGDRQGEVLQRGKSTWTLSHCAWKPAKRAVMVWKRSRTASRWSSPFLRRKSARLLETSSLRRKVANFSYCLREGILEVGAEDMMAVLDAIDDGGQLAAHPAVQARAEDLGDLVAGQPPQAELATALEQLVDGKVALEDEVAAILDLGDRIKAREIELLALLGGELRPQDQGPVVEPFADDLRAQLVGGGLQRGDVVDREEGVVGLAEANLRPLQLLLDELWPLR